ncbi:DUF72 domain-containing protein [Adhaeribacter rhizoryzae]|uniref:DUF72 domain-containing protein n=2 Tax=Adhaeribacter rhizoryzae TaxID=2607907 RepID=A0A5M6DGM9_9BACT|nr:DUF72 domain-containing protein [Adhaeribacter rhizoryzae]
MPQQEYLAHYLKYYQTVEINNSFYRLPTYETFANWRQAVPDNFVFAVKASRYITHMKKLKDPQASLANFLQNVTALEEKLGPILFQLPPRWHCDLERFRQFLQALPSGLLYTFEFRDQTWYNEPVYDLLRQYNAAFCIYDLEQHLSPIIATANFVYIRLHGPVGKYNGSYSDEALMGWAEAARTWHAEGKAVYIYFDNDIGGHAVTDSQRLIALLNPS